MNLFELEGNILKPIIPLAPQVTMQATMQADEEVKDFLGFCVVPRTRSEQCQIN